MDKHSHHRGFGATARLLAVGGLIAIPTALAAQQWAHVGSLSPRLYSAMAYDNARGRTVMFGGQSSVGYYNQTWEWDGSTWTNVSNSGPWQRVHSAMAHDLLRGRTVLFGGSDGTLLGDTWEWDGNTWTLGITTGPSPRLGHAMVYDLQRGRVMLFGGHAGGPGIWTIVQDTWEWDGNTWTQASSSGPPARYWHSMAYDTQRARSVVFGGYHQTGQHSDTWEWDGTTWVQASTTGPSARIAFAMAYDAFHNKTVLFGGVNWSGNELGDTWEWDGANWAQVSTSGPPMRSGHAMAYDMQRKATVLFGGGDHPTQYGDTWEWSAAGRFDAYGTGCPGTPTTVAPCAENNANGGTLLGVTWPFELGVLVSAGSITVQNFEMFTQSTGGTVTIPARIYPFPTGAAIASTTMTIGPTPGFYAATFPTPVPVSGPVLIAVDISAQTVVAPIVTGGTTGVTYLKTPGFSVWNSNGTSFHPSFRLACLEGTVNVTPAIGNTNPPVLGATYDVTLSDALPATGAIIITGLSDAVFQGVSLPATLPNAPGCELLASAEATEFLFTSATGTATDSITVPNAVSFVGIELFHQWAVLDGGNPLGIVVSDAGRARMGF